MKMLLKCSGSILPVILLCLTVSKGWSQLTISAQLRTRAELRDGQGAPLPNGSKPAFFISQRSRLMLDYSGYRLKLGLSIQDVRVWGQDVSSINRTTVDANDGIMLHEAWAEIMLTDTTNKKYELSLKAGRQELVYDDQRLIGNLDWLQQARRHDAAVIKLKSGLFTVHGGFAYNQNKENSTGTVYNATPPGNYTGNTNGGSMYKSFEFIHANRKLTSGSLSFLIFADQFNKYHTVTENSKPVKTWDNGAWTRYTTGFYVTNHFKLLDINAAAYYQGGKTSDGRELSAALLSVATQFPLTGKLSAGPGVDYTTGGAASGKSNVFDPLYGTPHKFWGLMDYFYAGSGFGNKGLVDYYLKAKLKASKTILLSGDVHQFYSASGVYGSSDQKMSRQFGTEADLVLSYSFSKSVTIETGYSHFFSTGSLSSAGVKNIVNGSNNNNWAYVSINIKPDLFTK